MISSKPTITDVRAYWEGNPLGTLEAPHEPGSHEFFKWHDRVRWEEEGVFARHLYEFDYHRDEKVLDIGCGNGWLVYNFAKGGAIIYGIDLTQAAVDLTRQRLTYDNLSADLRVGNAEELPFDDGTFDYVTSAGVLHHTPDTPKAISEAIRVVKRGGRGMISLYYKHPLMRKSLWPLTRSFIRLLFGRVPGRHGFGQVETVDDLVRLYDGDQNPIGKAYSHDEVQVLFRECRKIEACEIHFFPTRFLITGSSPTWLRKIMDRLFGLMIYVQFRK